MVSLEPASRSSRVRRRSAPPASWSAAAGARARGRSRPSRRSARPATARRRPPLAFAGAATILGNPARAISPRIGRSKCPRAPGVPSGVRRNGGELHGVKAVQGVAFASVTPRRGGRETRSAAGARTRRTRPSRSTARRSTSCSSSRAGLPTTTSPNPWRFRVLGPRGARGAEGGRGARGGAPSSTARRRSSAASVVSSATTRCATRRTCAAAGCAVVHRAARRPRPRPGRLLAHPGVLRTPEGARRVGVPDGEHVLGLIHLGRPRQEQPPPERAPLDEYVTYLA